MQYNEPHPNIPTSIGIIMDGNRRFAREHGLSQMEGHRLGYEKLREAARWCHDAGIKYVTVYAFSTENWNRTPEEVSYLTELFKTLLIVEAQELQKENIAIRFMGEVERFGAEVADSAHKVEAENPISPKGTLVVALSYGGRPEILSAVNTLISEGATAPVNEDIFSTHLWSAGVPDPDLILRTGGEKRLSNFLPWQSVYSELFFSDTFWPAFTHEEFLAILEEYAGRERRRGR